MSRDVQELLALRVMAILGTFIGDGASDLKTVWRYRGSIESVIEPDGPDGDKVVQLPTAILLDGRCNAIQNRQSSVLRGVQAAAIMLWEPEIIVILMPTDNGTNEDVGPKLSAFRMALNKKIHHDDTLIALCGSNGGLEYRGCETDAQSGSEVGGAMTLSYAFQFTFKTSDL